MPITRIDNSSTLNTLGVCYSIASVVLFVLSPSSSTSRSMFVVIILQWCSGSVIWYDLRRSDNSEVYGNQNIPVHDRHINSHIFIYKDISKSATRIHSGAFWWLPYNHFKTNTYSPPSASFDHNIVINILLWKRASFFRKLIHGN